MQIISLKKQKEIMVKFHLQRRGIDNKRVLQAMMEVPREEFVQKRYKKFAYSDTALPIGYEQTISQPYTVALSLQALNPLENDTVLDIGTGSGYQAALLSRLCKKVISVERISELAKKARNTLGGLGYDNVKVIVDNAVRGYLKGAPYDGIVCAAATQDVPSQWKDQLKDGGCIVFPKNMGLYQKLVRVKKKGDLFTEEIIGNYSFVFVPLVDMD